MKTTTRYTLLAVFFVLFVIIAPLLIFYVSGRRVNFTGEDTAATGILDAKSNPSSAKLLIDGKEHSSTPSIARFLNRGEYVVTLTKDGYYDWTKRLPIEAGKVTYAQEGVTEVQLIKKSDPENIISGGVNAFTLVGDTVWFVKDNSVVQTPLDDTAKQTVTKLNFKPTSITLLRDKHHLFLGSNTVINTNDNSIVKIPLNVQGTEQPDNIAVTPNNVFVYTNGDFLDAYYPDTGQVTRLVANSVSAFTMLGNTGYFLEHPTPYAAKISSAYWDGNAFRDFQPLIESTRLLGSGIYNYLYITDNKELFCDCGSMYRVGQTLEPLTSDVITAHLDLQTNELSYQTVGNELWFYNFLSSRPQLITRGYLDTNTSFLVRSSIGYAFIGNTLGLQLIELDNRDKPNRYQLLTDKQVWEVALSTNQKTIVALQDGSLIKIDIRN